MKRLAGLAILVVLLTFGVGTVSAETGDSCTSYDPVEVPAQSEVPFTDTINSDDDTDAFRYQSTKGDYLTYKIRINDTSAESAFDAYYDTYAASMREYTSYENNGNRIIIFKLYDEQRSDDEDLCVRFKDEGYFTSQYNYSVWIAKNEEPEWFTDAQLERSEGYLTEVGDTCTSYDPVEVHGDYDTEGPLVERIDSAEDADAFRYQSTKGDYLAYKIRIDDTAAESDFKAEYDSYSASMEDYTSYEENGDRIIAFKIYDEEASSPGDLCVTFKDEGYFDEQYNYSVWVAKNDEPSWYEDAQDSDPATTDTTTTTTTADDDSDSETNSEDDAPNDPEVQDESDVEPTSTTTEMSIFTPPGGETAPETTTANDGEQDSDDGIQDSDGDGVIDSADYAPDDPEIQEKSDLVSTTSGGTTTAADSGASSPGTGDSTTEADSGDGGADGTETGDDEAETVAESGPGFGLLSVLVALVLATAGLVRRR